MWETAMDRGLVCLNFWSRTRLISDILTPNVKHHKPTSLRMIRCDPFKSWMIWKNGAAAGGKLQGGVHTV